MRVRLQAILAGDGEYHSILGDLFAMYAGLLFLVSGGSMSA